MIVKIVFGALLLFSFPAAAQTVVSFADVVQKVISAYAKGSMQIQQCDDLHEAHLLMLNIEKAKKELNWHPIWNADTAIKETVEWYRRFYAKEKMSAFSLKQIEKYSNKGAL